jgi:hypothetical protein
MERGGSDKNSLSNLRAVQSHVKTLMVEVVVVDGSVEHVGDASPMAPSFHAELPSNLG